jgi:hypothetical protein
MPDPTNIDQIQQQHYQESQLIYRRTAVEHALLTLDPTSASTLRGFDYQTLVERLRMVLDAELTALTAAPAPEGEPR